jgi:hypothetical protein
MSDPISIVFTASDWWFGRLIRRITGGRTNHVYIEYTSQEWSGRWKAEAATLGTRKVLASKNTSTIVARFDCLFPVPLSKIADDVGKPYNFIGILNIGLVLICARWLRKKIKKPFHNTKGLFCSEWTAKMMKIAELPGTSDWDPEMQSPEDLLDYCLPHPELFKPTIIS